MRETTEHCDRARGTDATLQDRPGSWVEALAGTILFTIPLIVLGVKWVSSRGYLPDTVSHTVGLAVSAIPLFGLSAGWAKGFPRWSYPYAGFIVALPCLTGLWLPFLVIVLILLLSLPQTQTHSQQPLLIQAKLPPRSNSSITSERTANIRWWRPLRQLGQTVRRDWTLLSFCFYGVAPMALLFAFEKVARDYEALYMAVSSLILAAGALAYMRSARTWQRTLALLSGATLSWAVATVYLANYWHGRQEDWMPRPGNGYEIARWSATGWGALLALILAPALLTLLRRSDKSMQAA
jgi:hypothetical protein